MSADHCIENGPGNAAVAAIVTGLPPPTGVAMSSIRAGWEPLYFRMPVEKYVVVRSRGDVGGTNFVNAISDGANSKETFWAKWPLPSQVLPLLLFQLRARDRL